MKMLRRLGTAIARRRNALTYNIATFASSSSSSSSSPSSSPPPPLSPSSASYSTQPPPLPTKARVIVVGGGIIGTSIAYHLAKLGGTQWTDEGVLLLEQHELTAGTTWHAAGLMVTFGSLSETSTEFRKYSKDLYQNILPKETDQETGFSPVGFIELATNADRLEEFRRVAAFNRYCGVDVHEIDARHVSELFPLCRTDDVLAGFYVSDDGRVNPVDATMALAKGARLHGATLRSGVRVRDVLRRRGAVCGVVTECGARIEADVVVNASGMWARQFAARHGVCVPNQAAEHYYLLTDRIDAVRREWPVIEDPASYTYIRPEGAGLMVGLFEGTAAAWQSRNVPADFAYGEIEPDWERMAPYVEAALGRLQPEARAVGAKKFFCGPESFTPDLAPCFGESPELRNYFVTAGLNSIGILTGGGIGRALAHWIVDGAPDVDITAMNVDRFLPYQATREYRERRVTEALGQVYALHYPYKQMQSARHVMHTPFFEQHRARNAHFRAVSGWEAPDWFAPTAEAAHVKTHSWQREHWFEYWAAEHAACRERAALFDMSFMSKFLVQGADAARLLQRISTANVDGEAGRITYTQWLNERGTMEADVTVTKLAENEFLVVATDTAHRHVEAHMKRHAAAAQLNATVADVSGAYAQLNVQGPASRTVMAAATGGGDDAASAFSNDAFAFRDARYIDIGCARVLATRITYVGELGWELFIPVQFARHVYERLLCVGEPLGLRCAGLKALASLRLEKRYIDYGHDVDNTDTLLECGLGFTADYDKAGGFVGKEATLEQKRGGVAALRRRLVQALVKDAPHVALHHGEVLWRDGVRVGDVRAAAHGHTLGGAVGVAAVERDRAGVRAVSKQWLADGEWCVEVGCEKHACVVSLSALYDARNERIKAD